LYWLAVAVVAAQGPLLLPRVVMVLQAVEVQAVEVLVVETQAALN
jgi:DNA topoisomerase VI subunit A